MYPGDTVLFRVPWVYVRMAFDIYYRYSTAVVQSGSVRDLVRELQRKGANSAKGFFIIGLDWPGHISSMGPITV